jgi:hypothetical protein
VQQVRRMRQPLLQFAVTAAQQAIQMGMALRLWGWHQDCVLVLV